MRSYVLIISQHLPVCLVTGYKRKLFNYAHTAQDAGTEANSAYAHTFCRQSTNSDRFIVSTTSRSELEQVYLT